MKLPEIKFEITERPDQKYWDRQVVVTDGIMESVYAIIDDATINPDKYSPRYKMQSKDWYINGFIKERDKSIASDKEVLEMYQRYKSETITNELIAD